MHYIFNVDDLRRIFSGKSAIVKGVDKKDNVTLVTLQDKSTAFVYTAPTILTLVQYLEKVGCKSTFKVEKVASGFINRGTLVEELLKACLDYLQGKPFLQNYEKSLQGLSDYTLSIESAKKLGIALNSNNEIEIKYSNSNTGASHLSNAHKIKYILMVVPSGVYNVLVSPKDYENKPISYNRAYDSTSKRIDILSKVLGF